MLKHSQGGDSSFNLKDHLLNLSFRIHQLEKDLFYYKKTSRDLKKKLRELLSSNPVTPMPEDYSQGPGMLYKCSRSFLDYLYFVVLPNIMALKHYRNHSYEFSKSVSNAFDMYLLPTNMDWIPGTGNRSLNVKVHVSSIR